MADPSLAFLDGSGLPLAVCVVVGREELLVERAVATVVKGARAADRDTDVRELKGASLTLPELDELLSPSLFGERRVLVLRGLGEGAADDDPDGAEVGSAGLAPDVLDRLVRHAGDTPVEAHVVVLHREANRARAQLTALRKVAAVVEVKKLKGKDVTAFVVQEFENLGVKCAPEVPAAVIQAVGNDLRALASACSQLVVDRAGEGRLGRADVEAFFAGRMEADAFALADAVLEGRTPAALSLARHALAVGAGAPAITAAMAYSLRSLVRASAAPRHGSLPEQAAAVGLRDWQLRKARAQLSGWTPEGVGRAIRVTAEADAAVKGAAVDSDYAVEQMIIRIGRARATR
jgi:DNA polymerase-3 subunit delta